MLLAIDVGNSNIVIGIFDRDVLVERWRLQTELEQTPDELGPLVRGLVAAGGLEPGTLREAVLASVVPQLTGVVGRTIERNFGIPLLVVDPVAHSGMPILYDKPSDVGVDRVVNAVAAYERFGRAGRRPVIVCDFGTATKFEAVSGDGEYLGGAICPGVETGAEALFERTARLPHVAVRRPERVIGRSTVGAIESGLFWGHVGMVEGLIARMQRDLGGGAACVATGGLASLVAPDTRLIEHVDPNLTLEGLRLVWERNRTAGK